MAQAREHHYLHRRHGLDNERHCREARALLAKIDGDAA